MGKKFARNNFSSGYGNFCVGFTTLVIPSK